MILSDTESLRRKLDFLLLMHTEGSRKLNISMQLVTTSLDLVLNVFMNAPTTTYSNGPNAISNDLEWLDFNDRKHCAELLVIILFCYCDILRTSSSYCSAVCIFAYYVFLFSCMDLRLFHWISHKYLLLTLSLIDSSWNYSIENNIEIVECCQQEFCFSLPSITLAHRTENIFIFIHRKR